VRSSNEYNYTTTTIIIIIGATVTISKSFRQHLSNMPGKHKIKELQKQPYWTLHTYSGK
jgi:hypothetical protein